MLTHVSATLRKFKSAQCACCFSGRAGRFRFGGSLGGPDSSSRVSAVVLSVEYALTDLADKLSRRVGDRNYFDTLCVQSSMVIGILGAGRMGRVLARLFIAGGHSVILSNSRDPHTLDELVAELGAGASASKPEELSSCSDVVVLATRWEQIPQALASLKPPSGMIIIDATNHRFGPKPGDVYDIGDDSSSEVVARMVPQARIVKAFNHAPISSLSDLMTDREYFRKALFIAGDDPDAKAIVASIIRDVGGEPFDTGTLSSGGMLQDTGRPLSGHGRLLWIEEGQQLLESLRTKVNQ